MIASARVNTLMLAVRRWYGGKLPVLHSRLMLFGFCGRESAIQGQKGMITVSL